MRIPIIAANWKMNKTAEEAREFASALLLHALPEDREFIIAASPTILAVTVDSFSGSSVSISAQNMHFEESGAFTGETSADQVIDTGATHVIIGHSERRHLFGEDNEMLNKKMLVAENSGLIPIYCVGETLDQRNSGETQDVVKEQIELGLAHISNDFLEKLIIAYEPVWAIGTGETATPEQAEEMHLFLRELLPEPTRILYGGSVKPENCVELALKPSIDGFLIGGASLDPEAFWSIAQAQFTI